MTMNIIGNPIPTPSVNITSTGTPALNGTYAIDDKSQGAITALSTGLIAGKPLPSGGSTFNYADVTGAMHAFTKDNFLNFATAIEQYVYQAAQAMAVGDQPPSNDLTID